MLSKRNQLHQKTDQGFTLVEAVVTIFLVGLIFTPLALMFNKGLESTVKSRQQLQANQIGQQYIEAVKTMPYVSLKELTDKVQIAGQLSPTIAAAYDLPPVPADYRVKLGIAYDAASGYDNQFESPDFKFDQSIQADTVQKIDYDMVLYLDSAVNNKVSIYGKDEFNPDFLGLPANTLVDPNLSKRQVEIVWQDSGFGRKITLKQGASTAMVNLSSLALGNTIVIFCADQATVSGHLETDFFVDNRTADPLNIMVFETDQDQIRPVINPLAGPIKTLRGLQNIDSFRYRLYKVTVEVEKAGQVLETLTTTVIAR